MVAASMSRRCASGCAGSSTTRSSAAWRCPRPCSRARPYPWRPSRTSGCPRTARSRSTAPTSSWTEQASSSASSTTGCCLAQWNFLRDGPASRIVAIWDQGRQAPGGAWQKVQDFGYRMRAPERRVGRQPCATRRGIEEAHECRRRRRRGRRLRRDRFPPLRDARRPPVQSVDARHPRDGRGRRQRPLAVRQAGRCAGRRPHLRAAAARVDCRRWRRPDEAGARRRAVHLRPRGEARGGTRGADSHGREHQLRQLRRSP